MKKTALLLSVILALGCTACGKDTPAGGSNSEEGGSPAAPAEAKPRTCYEEFSAFSGTEGRIDTACSFSEEGVAWVYLTDSTLFSGNNAHHAVYAINTSGEVLFKLYENTGLSLNLFGGLQSVSAFCRGVALAKTQSSGIYDLKEEWDKLSGGSSQTDKEQSDTLLVNTEGKVLWSMNKDGKEQAEKIFGAGNVETVEMAENNFNNFNGYAAVKIHVNSFDTTGDYYTILKPDGTFLMEPVKANKFQMWSGKIYAEWQGDYVSDGDNYHYINLLTGETVDAKREVGTFIMNPQPAVPDGGWEQVQIWQNEYDRSNQDGLLYDQNVHGFTDKDGNVVIDLSEYTLYDEKYRYNDEKEKTLYFNSNGQYMVFNTLDSNKSKIAPPRFHNGYAVVTIRNQDDAPFFVIYDTKGEKVCQPTKYPNISKIPANAYYADGYVVFTQTNSIYGTYSDDPVFYMYTSSNADGSTPIPLFYTLDGQPASSLGSYCGAFPFSQGIAQVLDPESNERFFIDKNGSKLFQSAANAE